MRTIRGWLFGEQPLAAASCVQSGNLALAPVLRGSASDSALPTSRLAGPSEGPEVSDASRGGAADVLGLATRGRLAGPLSPFGLWI